MGKIKSRKFIVFTIWTILVALVLIFKVANIDKMIEYYFFISGIYIGGNVLAKLILGDKR